MALPIKTIAWRRRRTERSHAAAFAVFNKRTADVYRRLAALVRLAGPSDNNSGKQD